MTIIGGIYNSMGDGNAFNNSTGGNIESPNEHEDTPRNSGVMIHIVPETSRARWNHIEDLDSFFTRMYSYHQKHGFVVILLDEIFQLCEFTFVIWLLTFTLYCIRHSVLFGNSLPPEHNSTKVTLGDVIIPMGQCVQNFGIFWYLILILAILYFFIRIIKMLYHISQYSDMKKFYNTALQIEDSELDNITWHVVKKKIREVQAEQHMCIDKEQLTELDIYHRILRFKNYMVALMNKNLLPSKFTVPFFGEVVYLSHGLLYNVDFILFRGPGSPFQNNWQIRDDYSLRSNQADLAQRLSKKIMWVALANLMLAPIIFIWQCIYFSFSYANILRKEPGALGTRTWSNYGRLYLRHFNELEHELEARLNRAFEPADKYLSSFSSPITTLVAKNIIFMSGGVLVLILALGIYEEFVFQVEHVLTIITALSAIGLVCRTLIPSENLVWCPEQLMTAILAHVHYLPTEWKGYAHTHEVREAFGRFFQFKAAYLLNEICSPLITPFILMFVFRPKALEIVKFFKNFTVSVKGVGNVCSFAQMDVRKHGNPEWQPFSCKENMNVRNLSDQQADNGKTELSLIHFVLTNPEWRQPPESSRFVNGIRRYALKDLVNAKTSHKEEKQCTAMEESLMSFGNIGEEYLSIAFSVLNNHNIVNDVAHNPIKKNQKSSPVSVCNKNFSEEGHEDQTYAFEQMLQQNLEDVSASLQQQSIGEEGPRTYNITNSIYTSIRRSDKFMPKMRVSKVEGPLEGPLNGLLYSLNGSKDLLMNNHVDMTAADMCLNTLYLHELHRRNVNRDNPGCVHLSQIRKTTHIIPKAKTAESTPLLDMRS